MTLRFDKYHGLGNDFIVVEAESDTAIEAARVQALCERHFGVGADGVLIVSPPTSPDAQAKMSVINADGSRPEMCGNGLRCVALHLARRSDAAGLSFGVQTDAGVLSCEIERTGQVAMVTSRIGRARVLGDFELQFGGGLRTFHHVSTGNPHLICFDAPREEAVVDREAPQVSRAVPDSANVELAAVSSSSTIDLVVWERGVGRTLACGTGAAATVAAACVTGRCALDREIETRLPGGSLYITVARKDLELVVRGPAEWVFAGEVP